MPYEVFLALRYLRSRPKRRLARVTALMSILGIAMGVAALIVALALGNGFRDEMRDKILQGTAHLSVLRSDGRAIVDQAKVVEQVRQVQGVVSASTTTYDGALARGTQGSAYAVLRGIEAGGNVAQARGWIIQGGIDSLFDAAKTDERSEQAGEPSVPQAVVGSELAAKIGVAVGDVFEVIGAEGGPAGRGRLRVAGVFRSGLFEYDATWIFLPLQTVESFGSREHAGSVISVQVNNADNVKQVAARVLKALGDDYTVVDWQQANQPLFAALALERRMAVFIIGLIVAIAALNITTMLILVVVERRRDIAILSTLGATRAGVMLVFIIEGAVVGAIGAVLGVLLGLAACFIGNHYKLVSLPADVYSISNVPLHANVAETLIAATIAFGLSVLATVYPARNAARMRPVEVLRDA
ncbi:MAG TPA: ABC transporter permease [Pyrinomonadaceae bacterium]|nr:ABC transporter permease [Pyrinomonadaceae bacterium]